jgi:hypothetical protein
MIVPPQSIINLKTSPRSLAVIISATPHNRISGRKHSRAAFSSGHRPRSMSNAVLSVALH